MMRASVIAPVFLVGFAGFAAADENACKAVAESMTPKTQEITARYTTLIDAQQNTIKTEADSIQKDAENSKPTNAVEGGLKFKIDVSSHIESVKLDLPTVTIRDQTIFIDMPEVAVRQQKWKYDVPQVTMRQQCINKPPEIVCHNETKNFGLFKTDVPVCRTRGGGRMCTDIPEVKMATTETTLGVPEVTMKRQRIVLGIPEFKMERQEIKISVPDFTIRDIEADMKSVKERSDKLAASAKDGTDGLTAAMKAEVAKVASDGTSQIMECQKDEISKQQAASLAEIDKNISVVRASLDQANAVGAAEFAKSMNIALTDLIGARSKTVEQFTTALNAISAGVPSQIMTPSTTL